MSDLSTIDDLLKEKPANDDGQALDTPEETKDHVDLHISSPEIEKKFES